LLEGGGRADQYVRFDSLLGDLTRERDWRWP
jgi:hypothetical protein